MPRTRTEEDSSETTERSTRARRKTVGDYPERSYEEASKGVPNFDPGNPEHQEARLEHSADYVEETPAGYIAPNYEE